MRIFVLTATYGLRVSRKSHLRDHPSLNILRIGIWDGKIGKRDPG